MFNSQEILAKVAGERARAMGRDKRPHEERLKDLYLISLSRDPSTEELTSLLAYIDKRKGKEQAAYEDIV
jgi:hypothetical protein